MNPEPRPSYNCHACMEYEKCPCSCHVVGNLMVTYHHHFNAVPDSMTGITEQVLQKQLEKRNGLH